MGAVNEENQAALFRVGGLAFKGDQESIRQLEDLGAKGSVSALHYLGYAYWGGRSPDPAKAEHWFRAAYEARNEWSFLSLGRFLYQQRRDEEAEKVFAEGAAEGYGSSCYWLAILYLREVPRRSDKMPVIRTLLEQASGEGYVWATRLLAIQLIRGRYGLAGLPQGIARLLSIGPQAFRIISKNPDDRRLLREP